MTESHHRPKLKWSDAEKLAVEHAFQTTKTAEEFFASFRAAVPNAPDRSVKAYLTHLCRQHPDPSSRKTPVYFDLTRANAEEIARTTLSSPPSVPSGDVSYLDEIDVTPSPPVVPPRPAPSVNFVKPPVEKPPVEKPVVSLPRHYRVPPFALTAFRAIDISDTFAVPGAEVQDALRTGVLPSHDGEVRREVFMSLHEAMSDGLDFNAACGAVREKFAPKPEVPAESLYVPENVETDPNKVREGYVPNPKGPSPVEREDEVASLDDPNPDALAAFTVEGAARELGLTDATVLLTAILRDGFPAVKIDGKWSLTRADLKRTRALRDGGLPVEEALKRAGAPAVDSPTVPNEESWTDHLAPLTLEEAAEVARLTPEGGVSDARLPAPPEEIPSIYVSLKDVAGDLHIYAHDVYRILGDYPMLVKRVNEWEAFITREAFRLIEEKWRKGRDFREACSYAAEKLGLLPPPPAEVCAAERDERQWALEALGEGVFTVEQALKIVGVTDTPRNRWALTLFGRGDITLTQAARLLK